VSLVSFYGSGVLVVAIISAMAAILSAAWFIWCQF
jgi:hypothetical protein